MTRKVAILVLNYAMQEMTDALVASIKRIVKHPHDLFVIDNGSPEGKVAETTTHRTEENRRITGGFNFGLDCIRGWEARATGHESDLPEGVQIEEKSRGVFPPALGDLDSSAYPYDAVWFVCNDIRLRSPTTDPLRACMHYVERARAAAKPIGIIHPSMEPARGTWNHPFMVCRGKSGIREADWVDIICPVYTREMLETMGWEFDPALVHGWGIDRYTCAEAWWHNLRVVVCDDAEVWHKMGTTYNAGVDPEFEDFDAYKAAAGGAQGVVLSEKYGEDYMVRFKNARRDYYTKAKA